MQLHILQRTHAHDAATRQTTQQLLSLFPDATTMEYELPAELKSDFALFACLCQLIQTGSPEAPPTMISSMRDKAVQFCEQLLDATC